MMMMMMMIHGCGEWHHLSLVALGFLGAITPPTGMVLKSREDFSKDRFNYVATNLNPAAQYVVMGGKGKVAPVAVSQGAIAIASLLVLMSAVTTVLYVKKEWKVRHSMRYARTYDRNAS